MAIRLSFDVIGSTCGDLLRFADAVRASGTSPEVPLQQGGPNRIDIVDDIGGPARPTPSFGPPPHQHRPFGPPVSGFVASDSFPPGFSYQSHHHGHQSAPSYEPPRHGATIEVTWNGGSRRTDMSIETVVQLHALLGRAVKSPDLDETVRDALRNLRAAFSDQDSPGGS